MLSHIHPRNFFWRALLNHLYCEGKTRFISSVGDCLYRFLTTGIDLFEKQYSSDDLRITVRVILITIKDQLYIQYLFKQKNFF